MRGRVRPRPMGFLRPVRLKQEIPGDRRDPQQLLLLVVAVVWVPGHWR